MCAGVPTCHDNFDTDQKQCLSHEINRMLRLLRADWVIFRTGSQQENKNSNIIFKIIDIHIFKMLQTENFVRLFRTLIKLKFVRGLMGLPE